MKPLYSGLLSIAIFLASWARGKTTPAKKWRYFLWTISAGIGVYGLYGLMQFSDPNQLSISTINSGTMKDSVIAGQIGTLNLNTVKTVSDADRKERARRHHAREIIGGFVASGFILENYSRGVNVPEGLNWMPQYENWHKNVMDWLTSSLGYSFADEFRRPDSENLQQVQLNRLEHHYQGKAMSKTLRGKIRFLRSLQSKLDDGKIDPLDGVDLSAPKMGSDNIIIGAPPNHSLGNGNIIISNTDANGNVILNKGGTAIGNGAVAGPSGIAIGSNAHAGTN